MINVARSVIVGNIRREDLDLELELPDLVGCMGHEAAERLPRIPADLIVVDARGTNKVVGISVGVRGSCQIIPESTSH